MSQHFFNNDRLTPEHLDTTDKSLQQAKNQAIDDLLGRLAEVLRAQQEMLTWQEFQDRISDVGH